MEGCKLGQRRMEPQGALRVTEGQVCFVHHLYPASVITGEGLGHTSSNDSPKEGFLHQVHALDLQIRQ